MVRLKSKQEAESRAQPKQSAQDKRRRMSDIMGSPMKQVQGSQSSNVSNPGTMSAAEVRQSFETWMKIAADNKINASNTWNLALIDYFHDMTLLRDGDSINFQKASCTLDGCVKIYSSRVDSVDSETKKLLSGLADSKTHTQDDLLEDDGVEEKAHTKSSRKRTGNTLEKDFSNLNTKKFDLEFAVDPLFRKTAADFDEGGARGLLLNHLSLTDSCQIIFDASDSNSQSNPPMNLTPVADMIDLTKIRALLGSKLDSIWSQFVCPSFHTFSFDPSKRTTLPTFSLTETEEFGNGDGYLLDLDDEADDHGADHGFRNFIDPFTTANLANLGDRNDEPMFDDIMPSYDDDNVPTGQHEEVFEEKLIALDPDQADVGEALFSYFDTSAMKNWAGPEFWRSRSVKLSNAAPARSKKSESTGETKSRKTKASFELNLLEAEIPDKSTLFAKTSASITLPKTSKTTQSDFLLPEDIHVSSSDFLSLFLQPTFKVRFSKTQKLHVPEELVPNEDRPWEPTPQTEVLIDADAQDYAEGIMPSFDDMNQEGPNDTVPDPYDNPMFDLDDDDGEEGAVDVANEMSYGLDESLMDFSQIPVKERSANPAATLTFARKAKRVDIARLKENIWCKLADAAADSTKDGGEETMEDDANSAKVQGEKTFTDIVTGLDQFYPETKRRNDISVAFCFICVLHLANENNLSIQGSSRLDDLVIQQNVA